MLGGVAPSTSRVVGGGRWLLGTSRAYNMLMPGQTSYWANQKQRTYDEEELSKWKSHFQCLTKYSLQEIRYWRNAFDHFDKDMDGFISAADFQKNPMFSREKSALIKEYDHDRNNLIDFGEFVDAMFAVDVRGLKEAFKGFDSTDFQLEFDKYAVYDVSGGDEGKGPKALDFGGLQQFMAEHEFTVVSDTDAQTLLQQMDTDKDGKVSFDDFKQWIQAQ